MSKKPQEEQRAASALRINEEFSKMNPGQQRKFVDDTLTALVNMPKKKMAKLFKKFVKKGKPSASDLDTMNQLVVVFLHSVKDEFRYHYATMIFKAMNRPLPENMVTRLTAVRTQDWLHIGVSPNVYDMLFKEWERQGKPTYDVFFSNLMGNAHGK